MPQYTIAVIGSRLYSDADQFIDVFNHIGLPVFVTAGRPLGVDQMVANWCEKVGITHRTYPQPVRKPNPPGQWVKDVEIESSHLDKMLNRAMTVLYFGVRGDLVAEKELAYVRANTSVIIHEFIEGE